MLFKSHILLLILIVILCNIMEAFKKNRFNNAICPDWWIPSMSGVFLFSIIEIIGWIGFVSYLILKG